MLQLGIGILVIVALTVSLVVTRTEHVATGRAPAVVAGAASGFMNAAAGVGGPALSVYAVATQWPQAAFAATAQPYFVVIGTASLVGKLARDRTGCCPRSTPATGLVDRRAARRPRLGELPARAHPAIARLAPP